MLRIQSVTKGDQRVAVLVATPEDYSVREVSLLPGHGNDPPSVCITYGAIGMPDKVIAVPQDAWCEVDE